jgi:hypothetical protein
LQRKQDWEARQHAIAEKQALRPLQQLVAKIDASSSTQVDCDDCPQSQFETFEAWYAWMQDVADGRTPAEMKGLWDHGRCLGVWYQHRCVDAAELPPSHPKYQPKGSGSSSPPEAAAATPKTASTTAPAAPAAPAAPPAAAPSEGGAAALEKSDSSPMAADELDKGIRAGNAVSGYGTGESEDALRQQANQAVTAELHDNADWQNYVGQLKASGVLDNESIVGSGSDEERATALLMRQWANTSADSSALSLALQYAAQSEFGLSDAATGHFTSSPQRISKYGQVPMDQAGLQAFMRGQYNVTQQYLADKGITELPVFRGANFWNTSAVSSVDFPPEGVDAKTTVDLQPLSSFATAPDVAQEFSTSERYTGAYVYRMTMATQVPASRILSCAHTGFGCADQSELVVLGGANMPVAAHSWRRGGSSYNGPSGESTAATLKGLLVKQASVGLKTAETWAAWVRDIVTGRSPAEMKALWDHGKCLGVWYKHQCVGASDLPPTHPKYQPKPGGAPATPKVAAPKTPAAPKAPAAAPTPTAAAPAATAGSGHNGYQISDTTAEGIAASKLNAELRDGNKVTGYKTDEGHGGLKDQAMKAVCAQLKDDPDWKSYVAQAKASGALDHTAYGKTDEERCASVLIRQWANTSADASALSIGIQKAAQTEFGLDDAATSHLSTTKANPGGMPLDEAGLRAFVRGQYNATQDYLSSQGVTEIPAFRGMGFTKDPKIPGVDFNANGSDAKVGVDLQPLSSFATAANVAVGFANSGWSSSGSYRMVMATRVPANRVLSCSHTGNGCARESEIVVLGGANMQAAVHAWNPKVGSSMYGHSDAGKPTAASLKGMLTKKGK